MPMLCSKHLGSVRGMSFSELHNFFSSQHFDKDEVLVLGAHGVNACKKGELKNIFGEIKEARKRAAHGVIDMFQTQVDAWPEGLEKDGMKAWLDEVKEKPGYIKAADFVKELKKLAKPLPKDCNRRARILGTFDQAKTELRAAADAFETSPDVLSSGGRTKFLNEARAATNTLIDALEKAVTSIDKAPKAAPQTGSDHTKAMRKALVDQIGKLRQELAASLATNAPDQSISFATVWKCLEEAEQHWAELKDYPSRAVLPSVKALPAALDKATSYQTMLQTQMMHLLAKHQADGSDVAISLQVVNDLTNGIAQLKIVDLTSDRRDDQEAGALLQVAKMVLRIQDPLPTYADLFKWSRSIATMPGYPALKPEAPVATPPSEDQVKQRERLFGLIREVFFKSYDDDWDRSQGDDVDVSEKCVEDLASELEKAMLRLDDMPPRLRVCVEEMRDKLRSAKNGQAKKLVADDINALYVKVRDLEGFPAMGLGSEYSAKLSTLIRAQIDALERWKRQKDMSPPTSSQSNNAQTSEQLEEVQVAICLRALDDEWSRLAATSHFKEIDKRMGKVIEKLTGKLSWKVPTGNAPPLTVDVAIAWLKKEALAPA